MAMCIFQQRQATINTTRTVNALLLSTARAGTSLTEEQQQLNVRVATGKNRRNSGIPRYAREMISKALI